MILAASNLPTAELIADFLWVFGVGTLIVAVLHARKIPSLLGFLLTGLLVGPAGLGLVRDADAIEVMAELGIVLLMFTIGLEVSLADLVRMARQVLGGGLTQIALTTAVLGAIGLAIGLAPATAIAIGLIASASSTALVLRLLGDRGELRTPYGQLSLAILLLQDFAVVALMLLLPMLADGDLSASRLALALGRAVAIAAGIVVGARFVFPWVLARIVDLRSREIFLLTTLVAVFGTAWVADAAGLSLALGAFLAGLVVSESEFADQMLAEVLPFRDILNGLFFASVGLLVDREVVVQNLGLIAALAAGTVTIKAAIVVITGKGLGLDLPSALLTGVALAQVGEFALVLAQQGESLNLISSTHHSMIIAISVISMTLTPLVLPWASRMLRPLPVPIPFHPGAERDESDHVIIVGYGLNGRNVARALGDLNVNYVIVEMNRLTVETEKRRGVPIVWGDATRPAMLQHLHIDKARSLVSCVADPAATRDIVALAHHANPDMFIVARTRYVSETEPLMRLGADSVVPEEFETSLELIARVMRAYGATETAIHDEKESLRAEQYRGLQLGSAAPVEKKASV